MSKKIYIGNLNYATSQKTIERIFSKYGEIVAAEVVKDRFTEQSKGFAFVEFAKEKEALSAISALNGKELDGRKVRVNIAEEKPRSPYRKAQ